MSRTITIHKVLISFPVANCLRILQRFGSFSPVIAIGRLVIQSMAIFLLASKFQSTEKTSDSLHHLSLKNLKKLCDDTMTLILCRFHAEWQFWPETDAWARNPTLDSVIHQHVGEPIDSTWSAAGMYAGKFLTTMATLGSNILAEYYCVVVKRLWVLRGLY